MNDAFLCAKANGMMSVMDGRTLNSTLERMLPSGIELPFINYELRSGQRLTAATINP